MSGTNQTGRGAALRPSSITSATPGPIRRASRQRDAVAGLLAGTAHFQSAQEIHARLRRQGTTIGLTTVYRALTALAHDGTVDVLLRDDGEALYRQCSVDHHHHLVCRRCGRTIEVKGPSVEQWAERIADSNGFTDVSHRIEVYGLCPDCGDSTRSADAP